MLWDCACRRHSPPATRAAERLRCRSRRQPCTLARACACACTYAYTYTYTYAYTIRVRADAACSPPTQRVAEHMRCRSRRQPCVRGNASRREAAAGSESESDAGPVLRYRHAACRSRSPPEARVLPCVCAAARVACRPRRNLLLRATRVHACVRVVACAYACMCAYAYIHMHMHPCAHGRSVSTRPTGPRVAVPAFASLERPWVPVYLSRWPACAKRAWYAIGPSQQCGQACALPDRAHSSHVAHHRERADAI